MSVPILQEQYRRTLEHLRDSGDLKDPDVRARIAVKCRSLLELAFEGVSNTEWDEATALYREVFGDQREDQSGPQVEESTGQSLREVLASTDPDPKGRSWLSRYLEWTAEHEAPDQFHFGSALVTLAAGLRRRPLIQWEARRTYPNLYAILLGPTGSRKGSAMERAASTVSLPMQVNVLPTEGTPQGYAHALRRRWHDTETTADGLIVSDEMSVMLARDRYKDALLQWLTEWYDCRDHFDRALRGEDRYEFFNIYVCFLAATNMAWMRLIPEHGVTGGWLPRHLLFRASGPKCRSWNPKFHAGLERELVAELARMVNAGIPETIGIDESGSRYLCHWYEVDMAASIAREQDERFRAYLDRKQAAVMKVATVMQLVEGGPQDRLCAEWLDRARRIVDWTDAGVREAYSRLGMTKEGEPAHDVLGFIRRRGGAVSTAQVVRGLKNKYNAPQLHVALRTLHDAGDLVRVKDPVEGVRWRFRPNG